MKPQDSIRQAAALPGGHEVIFEFELPDRLTTAITPRPEFTSREQVREFLGSYFAARKSFIETVATVTGMCLAAIDELPGGLEAISAPIGPAMRQ